MYTHVEICTGAHYLHLDIPPHMLHIVIFMHTCVHGFTFVCASVHLCSCVQMCTCSLEIPHLLVLRRSPVSLLTTSPLVLLLSTVLVFIFAAVFNPYKNVYEVR